MALSDRDIVITPNKGQTDDPKIVFSGANASVTAQNITLRMYPDNAGTLSFEGSAGQLFAVTNDLTGTLFSVNDGSGIPSLEVNADGTVIIAEFSGNVGIGTGTPVTDLHVQGQTVITGRVGIGTANVVTLNSNIFSVYGTAMVFGNLDLANPTGGTSGIYFNDGTYQTTSAVSTPSFGAAGTVQFAGAGNTFSGNSANFFWDTANTRLGIGTNSPTNVLTVRSTVTPAWFNTVNSAVGTNNFEIIVGNGASTGTTIGYVNNTTVPYGYMSTGTSTRNLVVAANGRVGVGGVTTPQVALDVGGITVIGATWAGNSNFINPPANGLAVQGFVGVGTYTPLAALDVRGGVGVTAASNFGGALAVASLSSNGAVSGTTGVFSTSLYSATFNTAGTATVASLVSNGAISGTTGTFSNATGPQISLTGATSQWIQWPASGVAAPTFTTRSAGTKLVLFPQVGAAASDYAIGIESSTIWNGVPTTAEQFKWYGGTTQAALLTGAGVLTTTGSTTSTAFIPTGSTIPTNGVYLPAANTLGFSTNSVERMRFDTVGRAGLNVTTLNANLEVGGGALATAVDSQSMVVELSTTSSNADLLQISNNRNSTGGADWTTAGYRIQQKVDSTWMGFIQFNSGGSTVVNPGGISFGTGQTTTSANTIAERMRIDTNGNVGIGVSTVTAGYKVDISGGVRIVGGGAILLQNTGDITAYRAGGTTGVIFLNSTSTRYLFYNGTNYELNAAALAVGGAITATGEITAFSSDARLKTDVSPLTDALRKVQELHGVRFSWTEQAKELGVSFKNQSDVGVMAQDVQRVLPEAIRPAPFDTDPQGNSKSGENYLTVQYEKLTVLLIEAIKEQQQQIEQLTARVDSLEGKITNG